MNNTSVEIEVWRLRAQLIYHQWEALEDRMVSADDAGAVRQAARLTYDLAMSIKPETIRKARTVFRRMTNRPCAFDR